MLHRAVIALDVGGTSVKSAIVAVQGWSRADPTRTTIASGADAATILGAIADIIRRYMAEVDPATLAGIAIGFPGPFDYEAGISRIDGVAKYGSLYGINVKQELHARLADAGELPIVFRNDAEAAIVGEARAGAGQRFRRLIGVTLGTGCGSAFLVDGAPVTTGRGVPPNGWLYPLPVGDRRADDVFSIRGLRARLQAAGAVDHDIESAATMARRGDVLFSNPFGTFGADLGTFLRPFALDFAAEAILVLGGIANTFDCFGASLARALPIPVLPGHLGSRAALIGAADLLLRLLPTEEQPA